MSGWFVISSLDIKALSLALVKCPSASNPQQFTKCVCFMPRACAFSFILETKASSLPLMCSAIATHVAYRGSRLFRNISLYNAYAEIKYWISKQAYMPNKMNVYMLVLAFNRSRISNLILVLIGWNLTQIKRSISL